MRRAKRLSWRAAFLALACLATGWGAAEASPPADLSATLEAGAASLDWHPLVDERFVLTIAGPGGFTLRRDFAAGEAPSLGLVDDEGAPLPDGSYSWELRAVPRTQREKRSEPPRVQSGTFSIRNGRFLIAEPPAAPPPPDTTAPPSSGALDKNLVESGNLVVQGNACIGDACGTSDANLPPVFRLKATAPTLLFDDVGDPEDPGSSSRNWALRANPAGADLFSLADIDNVSTPLVVAGGAPDNSVYIHSNGDVGIGTSTPAEKFHVFENVDANTFSLVENPNTGASAAAILRVKSDTAMANFIAHGSGRTLTRFGQTLAGWSEILQVSGNGLLIGTLGATPLILGTNNTARVTVSSAGTMTVAGNFVATGTKSFAVVDPADARQAIYYAALEGPEAGTYFRGTARTSHGEAVIELPDHFARLTEPERMTVQLTPVGNWGQLYIAAKSPTRLVVRVPPGSADLEFDYLVQGVRKGYLDYQVKRPNTLPQ